jgi:succinate dehydrogenase / fumarate reductase cytochrome b subunit
MRFYEYPASAQIGSQKSYMVRLESDNSLQDISERLDFSIYDKKSIEQLVQKFRSSSKDSQRTRQEKEWLAALTQRPVNDTQVIAVSKDFGTADLLMLRNTFKSPLMMILYTIFVITACYHGFNGLWTFLIKWGVTLSERSQRLSRRFSTVLMVIVTFMGLAAIWGTYWINLRS